MDPRSRRLLDTCLIYATLLGMYALHSIQSSNTPPSRVTLACAILITLIPLATLFYLQLVNTKEPGPPVSIDWDGVRIAHKLWHWNKVEAVTLTMGEATCDCEVELHNGKVIVATLSEFVPSADEWLSRLRLQLSEHGPLAIGIDHPAQEPDVSLITR